MVDQRYFLAGRLRHIPELLLKRRLPNLPPSFVYSYTAILICKECVSQIRLPSQAIARLVIRQESSWAQRGRSWAV